MNLIFFGTSDYCLPVLEAIHKNFDLKLVVTRPDKPVGRKQILTPSATKVWAEKNNIPVLTPETLKKNTADRDLLNKTLADPKPDLAVVSDYGLIIPEAVFNIPEYGTLNIHFSKLPDLRGPSPVQFTILRGDYDAWITIFKLENPPELKIKMDAGPILHQFHYNIWLDDTTETLYTRLFNEAAVILPAMIKEYINHEVPLASQDHSKATFSRFITKEDGFVEWSALQQAAQSDALRTSSTQSVYNQFRAMTPWPGLWTKTPEGKRMIIRKCHLEEGKLILDEIQFEGKTSQKHFVLK